VEYNGGKAYADSVIISAGAWSQVLLDKIGYESHIKPIRGQIICVKPDKKLIDKIVLDGGHYLIPRLDGYMLIGSTMEDVGFIDETTEIAREELMNWAYSIAPYLSSASLVRHWSGLRPTTKDGKPIIGPVSDFKNIYLNTGHFRKGILQAPASAELLVDYLSGKSSFMDIEKFTNKNQTNIAEFA